VEFVCGAISSGLTEKANFSEWNSSGRPRIILGAGTWIVVGLAPKMQHWKTPLKFPERFSFAWRTIPMAPSSPGARWNASNSDSLWICHSGGYADMVARILDIICNQANWYNLYFKLKWNKFRFAEFFW